MELESSYNLLGIVRDDGIRTYRAIEKASGQELQVHLFAKPESEPDRALFKALRALPVSKRRELLEIGVEGDMPYIVTEKLPDDSTARQWFTKLSGIVAKPAGPASAATAWPMVEVDSCKPQSNRKSASLRAASNTVESFDNR